MRPVVLGLLCIGLASCASSLSQWDPMSREPAPLDLPGSVDPNSAYSVFAYGASIIESSPARAADVFYWASRLDPSWADPLYARRMAILMADSDRFMQYMNGNRRILASPGVQKVDSLYRRALMLNPFLQRRFDYQALSRTVIRLTERDIRRNNPTAVISEPMLQHAFTTYMQTAGPSTRGWVAHSQGRFSDALDNYRSALKNSREPAYLHADIARVLFMLGRYTEAEREMTLAVEKMHTRDEEELVRYYESKALYEHSIGLMFEQMGDAVAARDAYARALQEDLAYFPAHIRLGELAMAAGDTGTALNELALAVQIAEGDAAVRYQYADLLARAGRLDEAEAEARRALELEPLFAPPYRLLAEVVDKQGRPAEAVPIYRDFVERASRDANGLPEARRRLAELEAAASAAGGTRQ